MQEAAFMIIANVGGAKSLYIEAIATAKEGNFDEAEKKIKEADELYAVAHKHHFELISKEASGEKVDVTMILMHAEDQLLNAETVKIMALEIIELHKVIKC